jgi:hypothetical protein
LTVVSGVAEPEAVMLELRIQVCVTFMFGETTPYST